VRLSNGPATPEFAELPRHAKYPPAGTKQQMRSSSLWLDQADVQVGLRANPWLWVGLAGGWGQACWMQYGVKLDHV
jgi:hypothetical protein